MCVVSVTNTNVGLDHFYYITRDTKSSVLRYMSRTYHKSVLWKHHLSVYKMMHFFFYTLQNQTFLSEEHSVKSLTCKFQYERKCECINELHHNYEHYTTQLLCQQKYVVCSLGFFITHTWTGNITCKVFVF